MLAAVSLPRPSADRPYIAALLSCHPFQIGRSDTNSALHSTAHFSSATLSGLDEHDATTRWAVSLNAATILPYVCDSTRNGGCLRTE